MSDRPRRVPPAEYLALPLRAHALLAGVPLHDVTVVDLPGGGAGRTLADVRALDAAAPPSATVRALFAFRRLLGRALGWDRQPLRAEDSLLSRLTDDDRRASQVAPGTAAGPFLVVYQLPAEALIETRNATVHGFVCMALAPAASGYRLYWGVYVRPVSWLTRPYLAAIEPFRRFLVYPAMLSRIRRAWVAAYGDVSAVPASGPPRR
jgi:hypothetical protein